VHIISFDLSRDDHKPASEWELRVSVHTDDIPDDGGFLRAVAGLALARHLDAQHPNLNITWHESGEWGLWPGVLEVFDPARDAHRHVLVLAEPSAMAPRPVWPVRVPVPQLDCWDYDAIAWCYVPRRERLTAGKKTGQFVGWAWADEARRWTNVAVEPHSGHQFATTVWQTTCSALSDPDTLVSGILGDQS
jgi:hypothetical protein